MNSEDGTVQAGEYAKGDTATFFVYDGEGSVKVRISWKNCAEFLLCFDSLSSTTGSIVGMKAITASAESFAHIFGCNFIRTLQVHQRICSNVP